MYTLTDQCGKLTTWHSWFLNTKSNTGDECSGFNTSEPNLQKSAVPEQMYTSLCYHPLFMTESLMKRKRNCYLSDEIKSLENSGIVLGNAASFSGCVNTSRLPQTFIIITLNICILLGSVPELPSRRKAAAITSNMAWMTATVAAVAALSLEAASKEPVGGGSSWNWHCVQSLIWWVLLVKVWFEVS